MNDIIKQTFVRGYFCNGWNLFAIVFEDNGCFGVQCGHKCYRYKTLERAMKRYNDYLIECGYIFENSGL